MLTDRHFTRLRSARLEVAALLLGAALALAGFLALRGGADDGPNRTSHAAIHQRDIVVSIEPKHQRADPHTAAGVIGTATRDLTVLSQAELAGAARARSIVARGVTGALRPELERAFALEDGRVGRRLNHSRSARLFAGWPLGFRVVQSNRWQAVVAIWHLDVAASSALGLMDAQYTTTTYGLRWAGDSWRIDAVSSVSGPTPPAPGAPAAEVNEFAREVDGLSRYGYVP